MSDYKRLTERYKEHIDTKCENCKQWKKFGNGYACMDMTACNEEIINRLSELEDKIENGTLIERPPVKKGDRIWLVHKYWNYIDGRTKKEVVGRIVKRIFLNNDNSLTFSCLAIHKGRKLISIVKSTTFYKSWFLTKAEAEQKLKELKGEA